MSLSASPSRLCEPSAFYGEAVSAGGSVLRVSFRTTCSPLREEAPYGLRCYIEGADAGVHPCVSADAPELFPTLEQAEAAAAFLAARAVFPVHLNEVLEELGIL